MLPMSEGRCSPPARGRRRLCICRFGRLQPYQWLVHGDHGKCGKEYSVRGFDCAACLRAASVKEAAEHLRFVFTEVAVTTQRTVASKASNQPSFLHPALADQFHSFALEHIQNALRDLSGTTDTYDLQNVGLQHIERPLYSNDTAAGMIYDSLQRSIKASWGAIFGGGMREGIARSPSRGSLSSGGGGGVTYGQLVSVRRMDRAKTEMRRYSATSRRCKI